MNREMAKVKRFIGWSFLGMVAGVTLGGVILASIALYVAGGLALVGIAWGSVIAISLGCYLLFDDKEAT